jgi:hypothetical protein
VRQTAARVDSERCTGTARNAVHGTASGGEALSHGPKTKARGVAEAAGAIAAAEAPHDPLLGF